MKKTSSSWRYYAFSEPGSFAPVVDAQLEGSTAIDNFDDCDQFAASNEGDPSTWFGSEVTRYYLNTANYTPVFHTSGAQTFVNISFLAGPPRAVSPELSRRGDWVTGMRATVGTTTIDANVVAPARLLGVGGAPPKTGDSLTTISIIVNGKQELKVGEHNLGGGVVVTAAVPDSKKRIGSGYVERLDIAAPGFRMSITSSKANKLAKPDEQVKAVHFDAKFLEYEKAAVRGALPEMWHLQPMSEQTKALLVPPRASVA